LWRRVEDNAPYLGGPAGFGQQAPEMRPMDLSAHVEIFFRLR
jgi:hypothetical protein